MTYPKHFSVDVAGELYMTRFIHRAFPRPTIVTRGSVVDSVKLALAHQHAARCGNELLVPLHRDYDSLIGVG
jgi:hypothetical protein